ncbi:TolC family protein [Aureibacter tunicatorum]|uniref:Outer membrane protein n=1 Tax=Aureibacter tunicatorum TaxID=866807 RepID=A0AAE3XK34_9BACT|nr:TolC family protein [Aureibacter tunicatorum]MDR6237877.1 outer membrane protein [Aureibacter tunicatorum]BDD02912.1 transporter [Aureibacter tunicatorum]
MERIFTIAMLCLVLGGKANGQALRTLEECITYGLENNLELKGEVLKMRHAELDLSESKWSFTPRLNMYADAGYNFGRSIDPNTNQYSENQFFNHSQSINAQWELFNGFAKIKDFKSRKLSLQATEHNVQARKDLLAFDILEKYCFVQYYESCRLTMEKQLDYSQKNHAYTIELVELGIKAEADLYQVKAQLEKDKFNLLKAKNDKEKSIAELKRILNLPIDIQLHLDLQVLSEHDALLVEAMLEKKLLEKYSPALQAKRINFLSAESMLKAQRARYAPSLGLDARMNTGYFETNLDELGNIIRFQEQFKNNLNQYVGLNLTIPIFNQSSNRLAVQRAKIDMAVAENELAMEKLKLSQDYQDSFREWKALALETVQLKSQQTAEIIALQKAQEQYHEGLVSIFSLLESQNKLSATENELTLAKINYLVEKRMLLYYGGIRFWE